MVYELWHKRTTNMVDEYPSAIVAEERLKKMVAQYDESFLLEFCVLPPEAENEEDDEDAIDGPGLLTEIHRRAEIERQAAAATKVG